MSMCVNVGHSEFILLQKRRTRETGAKLASTAICQLELNVRVKKCLTVVNMKILFSLTLFIRCT